MSSCDQLRIRHCEPSAALQSRRYPYKLSERRKSTPKMTDENNAPIIKLGPMRMKFDADRPMELIPVEPGTEVIETPQTVETIKKTGEIFVAYFKARKNLLLTTYSHLKALVPGYWVGGAQVLVVSCVGGGVVVRIERKPELADKLGISASLATEDLPTIARTFSQRLVVCKVGSETEILPTDGMSLFLHL